MLVAEVAGEQCEVKSSRYDVTLLSSIWPERQPGTCPEQHPGMSLTDRKAKK